MEKIIKIINGIKVSKQGKYLVFSKDGTEFKKEIFHPLIDIQITDNEVKLISKKENRTLKKMIGTFASHINNMIIGVNEPYVYKLKICGTHFPITVKVQGKDINISNLLGEKVPRTCKIVGDAKVEVKGDIIEVTSVFKDNAGMTAGIIEKSSRRSKFDSRIFQDGIYMIEKAGKKI